jgi:glycosyltransferase involved in cell wall biosynthesis
MKKALIIYRFLPQYRVDFYNGLKEKLKEHNIELSLLYGRLNNQDSKKGDEVNIEWADFIPNRKMKIGGVEFLWQPCLKDLKDKDLVIVEQANMLLLNYYLMLRRKFGKPKMAFWGHGLNLQAHPNSLGNRFKTLLIKQADWWFPYTNGVKNFIVQKGFSENKISIVENAIDTRTLTKNYEKVSSQEISKLKNDYSIGAGPIGLYCGGMYKEKRLDFLLNACLNIRSKIKSFEMIFIGAGPEDFKVQKAADQYAWIHYLGPKFNDQKVPFFKMADLFLMPGLVGLAILDSFSMETPLVTTEYPFHSPEIEYLDKKINGIMTRNTIDEYSDEVISILNDSSRLKKLKKGCKLSAKNYTVEKMVNNFASGIIECLKS